MTDKVPTLIVPLRNRVQLFEHYFHRDGDDGLFVPGEVSFKVGEPIFLELSFLEEQRSFRIRGTVSWRRLSKDRQRLPPGIGVAFDPAERETRDLILEYARGREVSFTVRGSHRYPVTMQIAYASDSQFLTDVADDLSLGGVFIRTDNLLEPGTILNLKLKPPGYLLGMRLKGVVVWISKKASRRGMGLKFIFDSERKKRQVEGMIEQLKAAIIKEMRMQAPRKDSP